MGPWLSSDTAVLYVISLTSTLSAVQTADAPGTLATTATGAHVNTPHATHGSWQLNVSLTFRVSARDSALSRAHLGPPAHAPTSARAYLGRS